MNQQNKSKGTTPQCLHGSNPYDCQFCEMGASVEGTTPQAERTTPAWEQMYRRLLWESHAGYTHRSYLYGDDGEMQCNHRDCMLDFKRELPEALDAHIWKMNLKRLAEARAVAPVETPDEVDELKTRINEMAVELHAAINEPMYSGTRLDWMDRAHAAEAKVDDLNDAVMFLRIVLTRKDMTTLNCLKSKISDWLKRKGYEGSLLRESL